jgi:hypothetical protein
MKIQRSMFFYLCLSQHEFIFISWILLTRQNLAIQVANQQSANIFKHEPFSVKWLNICNICF